MKPEMPGIFVLISTDLYSSWSLFCMLRSLMSSSFANVTYFYMFSCLAGRETSPKELLQPIETQFIYCLSSL